MVKHFFKNALPKRFYADKFRVKTFETIVKWRKAWPESPWAYQATPKNKDIDHHHYFNSENYEQVTILTGNNL